jgi:hypothetical protein
MVYQVFVGGEEPHVNYRADLGRLASALAPTDRLKLGLQVIGLTPTEACEGLSVKLKKSRDKVGLVRQAVLSEKLWDFAPRHVEIVGSEEGC